jgi:hypothetical protein
MTFNIQYFQCLDDAIFPIEFIHPFCLKHSIIFSQEKHQSEEILKAVNRLSAMSSVEAEKRDLLFRQFEEQDRSSREEAIRAERARNEYIRREKEAVEHSRRIEEARIEEEKVASGID